MVMMKKHVLLGESFLSCNVVVRGGEADAGDQGR